jgi:hypothetical protein
MTPLRFRADGAFTIIQFADTHFKNGEVADEQTAALMAAVLDAEQPDLVVFTGDMIDGRPSRDPLAAVQRAIAPVAARGLPWAAVFGNHDDEGTLDRTALLAVMQSLPGCLAEAGPTGVSGVGNYVLPVLAAQSDHPAATLYFIDSNSYSETALLGYGWIRRDQIAWYLAEAQTRRAQNQGAPLPALAFFHIPLPEYNEVWDLYECFGEKYEGVCAPRINSGFFAALHEAGDVIGTFAGHDHVNDFVGDLHGIRLCYGRGSGYNTYGREGFARGARVIRLAEGMRDFTTWLRLEGGEQVTVQPRHEPEVKRPICVI